MGLEAKAIAQDRLDAFGEQVGQIRAGLHEVVVGQDEVIDQLLLCALTGSHALLVGVPGLAKTLLVKTLAGAFDWKYCRIQFTPDLMPADVTGYELLGRAISGEGPEMVFRPGPVFANLVLADEINRAAPKTQSALLEAMAEGHVTVGGQTYPLAPPFLVVATQNPIEQEGTYPLPEAQLDRFMMEIHVNYPTSQQEEQIVRTTTSSTLTLPEARMKTDDFLELRELVLAVPAADHCRQRSRPNLRREPPQRRQCHRRGPRLRPLGVPVHAARKNLVLAAKARALLLGRAAPTIEDLHAVAIPILRHRIIVNHRAIGDGITSEQVIQRILEGK